MEKITFKKLHDLVANVTYRLEKTYPIRFSVNNGNNTVIYRVKWNGELKGTFDHLVKALKKI